MNEGTPEQLLAHIQERAENLFLTRQLQCAEAVLVVLNQGLGGDLAPEMAVRLASAFPEGLGRKGCGCGALNGAALALGLFLGRKGPGYGNGALVRRAVGTLHDRFKADYNATCCRVLTKAFVYGSDVHFRHCAGLTGGAARLAAGLLLEHRAGILNGADWRYLRQKEARWAAGIRKLAGVLGR